jgi:L-lactate dehydrogenase complex protein LldF
VKINIPEVLIHLRNKVVKQQSSGLNILANPEVMALKAVGLVFRSAGVFHAAQKLGRVGELPLSHKDGQGEGWIEWLPGMLGGWTQVRDLHLMPKQTFREWFEEREKSKGEQGTGNGAAGDGH